MTRLTVITGPMFSGKSEELIRRLRRATYAQKNVLAIKPKRDTRSPNIVSRIKRKDGQFETFRTYAEFDCHSIEAVREMEFLVEDFYHKEGIDVLAIDEAQFFDSWIIGFIDSLLKNHDKNIEIIVSGLDMDYAGNPFGAMPQLMAMADEVIKESSICFKCKNEPGTMTQKKGIGSGKQIEVGDSELYESRCRACWTLPTQ